MLSCHHGRRRPVATARRAAPRRAGARLAVLLAVLGPVLGSGPARAAAGRDRLPPGAGRDTLTNPQTRIRWE